MFGKCRLYGLLDFGQQDGWVQSLPAAGVGDGDLATAAEIDAVRFEDAYGCRELGGSLADGAFSGG